MLHGSAQLSVRLSQVLSESQSDLRKHSPQRPLGASQNGRPPLVQSELVTQTPVPAAPAAPAVPAAPATPAPPENPPPQSETPASLHVAPPALPGVPLSKSISPSSQPIAAAKSKAKTSRDRIPGKSVARRAP